MITQLIIFVVKSINEMEIGHMESIFTSPLRDAAAIRV